MSNYKNLFLLPSASLPSSPDCQAVANACAEKFPRSSLNGWQVRTCEQSCSRPKNPLTVGRSASRLTATDWPTVGRSSLTARLAELHPRPVADYQNHAQAQKEQSRNSKKEKTKKRNQKRNCPLCGQKWGLFMAKPQTYFIVLVFERWALYGYLFLITIKQLSRSKTTICWKNTKLFCRIKIMLYFCRTSTRRASLQCLN